MDKETLEFNIRKRCNKGTASDADRLLLVMKCIAQGYDILLKEPESAEKYLEQDAERIEEIKNLQMSLLRHMTKMIL